MWLSYGSQGQFELLVLIAVCAFEEVGIELVVYDRGRAPASPQLAGGWGSGGERLVLVDLVNIRCILN